jgi:hypothetical protein
MTTARANSARERVPLTMMTTTMTRANTARVTIMMARMIVRTMTMMILARTTTMMK